MFIEALIDGKKIAYTDTTDFLVQIGRGRKGAYKTKYKITGSLNRAWVYYLGINIGNGYKKRIYVPTFNKPVLIKALTPIGP